MIDLLLPSLVSAVLVFFASFLIHMVLRLHRSDYRSLSNEGDARAVIQKGAPAPGQYVVPFCEDPKQQGSPEMVKKYEEGPVAVLHVGRAGKIQLGPFLGKWFVYSFVVALLAGHVAQAALGHGAAYMRVFHTVGIAAWLGFAWQAPADSIWMMKPWSVTLRYVRDGLIYAALTAGAHAWLWPD